MRAPGAAGVGVRLVTEDDAAVLAELLRASRDHLAPWEPARDDAFFTVEAQLGSIGEALSRYRDGTALPCVIVDGGRVVGRVTVSDVVRGAFQNGHLGYWVAHDRTGRGVATAAVAAVVRTAFDELGLHRLQAGTLVHNTASQRVLAKNGFVRFGLAPQYLRIAGRWQDHLLFQRLEEPAG